jgi:hypothetical protein
MGGSGCGSIQIGWVVYIDLVHIVSRCCGGVLPRYPQNPIWFPSLEPGCARYTMHRNPYVRTQGSDSNSNQPDLDKESKYSQSKHASSSFSIKVSDFPFYSTSIALVRPCLCFKIAWRFGREGLWTKWLLNRSKSLSLLFRTMRLADLADRPIILLLLGRFLDDVSFDPTHLTSFTAKPVDLQQGGS